MIFKKSHCISYRMIVVIQKIYIGNPVDGTNSEQEAKPKKHVYDQRGRFMYESTLVTVKVYKIRVTLRVT